MTCFWVSLKVCVHFWLIQTWGQVLDDQPMAVIPMAGLVKVQGLTTFVPLSTSTDGFGLMDPLDGDQQLFRQKLLLLHWLFCLLKGAMQVKHLPHCTLSAPKSSYKKWKSSHVQSLNSSWHKTYQQLNEYSKQSTHLPRVRYVQQHEDSHLP